MILNEEVFDIFDFDVPDVANADIEVTDMDATVPEAGPEVGVETLLMQAVKDIYGIIEGYNSLSIALTDVGNESAAISVADIIKMEHANIGVLQDILKEISPNAEAVDINESLNKSREEKYIYTFDIPEVIVDNFDIDGLISYVLERLIYHSDDKIGCCWYDNEDGSYSIETYDKDDNETLEDNFEKMFFEAIKDDNDYYAQTNPDFYDEDETIQIRDICNKKLKELSESLNEEVDDIGSKGGIYRDCNKVGEYWYSYGASSYGFNLINGETHHWYSKEDFLDFLKEHNYTAKRI